MAELKAVVFDQDGVLADTERDGHRVAFNKTFQEFGLGVEWDVPTYGGLLTIGGGKERMRHYFSQKGMDEDLDSLIVQLHKRKTEIFMEMLEQGAMSLRPGVARLVRETHQAGLKLAVCSTANEKAVNTLVRTLLGDEAYGWFGAILAGDVVKAKKPDPEIYSLALQRLGLSANECIVIEDNRNGLLAAKHAGIKCVVTVNGYTRGEDLSEADLIVSCLGDGNDDPAEVLGGKAKRCVDGLVTVAVLQELLNQE